MRPVVVVVLVLGLFPGTPLQGQRFRSSAEICELPSNARDDERTAFPAIHFEQLDSPNHGIQTSADSSTLKQKELTGNKSRLLDDILNLFNMAGSADSIGFHPMNQAQRNQLYLKTMVNPLGFAKVAFSAGIDQANDKPTEWEQGMSGYGKRFANILGQYSTQRTVSFVLGSALHEDNRYFNSGKQGFWRRTGFALSSSILARHDDGSRHFSISQLGGVAAGAFLARAWLPPSQSSATAAARSFGISTASNAGFSVVKEFLPDVVRRLRRKKSVPAAEQEPGE